jgi:hypothetical protein
VLAATTHVEEGSLSGWIDLFPTRLVFSAATQAASERLLGARGDDRAHMLDMVGELLPYVRGHVLPRIRAFRVPGLHVAYLVDQMSTRYQSGAAVGDDQHSSNDDGRGVGEEETAAAEAEVMRVADSDPRLREAGARLGQVVEWEDSNPPKRSPVQRQGSSAVPNGSSDKPASEPQQGGHGVPNARVDTLLAQDVGREPGSEPGATSAPACVTACGVAGRDAPG